MNVPSRSLLATGLAASVLLLGACAKGGPEASPSPQASGSPVAQAPSGAATPETTPSATPTNPAKIETNLDNIKVEGEPLKEPKVTVPAPWGIDKTQVKVLTPGNGATVKTKVEVHYQGVNGRTGKVFDQSYDKGQTASFMLDQVVAGFKKGLEGQQVGSRVLIAMPGSDAYDQMGGQPTADIKVGDTLIFVVDIISAPLEKAQGDVVPPKEGLPAVTETDGKPMVKLDGVTAPKELVVQPLIKGKGKEIKASDTITVKYSATTWSDGKVVQEVWDQAESGALSDLVAAWKEGLVGQTVGSRVMVIAPPEKAYGAQGNQDPAIKPNETIVFVIDLLDSEAAQ